VTVGETPKSTVLRAPHVGGSPTSVFPAGEVATHPWQVTLDAAIERYHDVLTAYVDKGGDDHLALKDRLAERGAVRAGRAICPFLRPQIVLRSQYDLMTRAVRRFRSAMVKAKDRIVADPELLDLLALSDGERRLFELNPDFKSFGVLTRLDTVLSADDFQMLELNGEGGFGGTYADKLTDLFEGFQPMREWSRGRRVTPLYQGNALMSALLDTWHEFGGTTVPRVAVVDWNEAATRAELDLVCERLQRHGVPARFVDPRELDLKEGVLSAGGLGIDIVYRRVRTRELLAREPEARALIDAYEARAVCMVNSFRAKLLDKKILFALLQDPDIQSRFTPEEVLAVRLHVPWTRRVAEGHGTGPDGEAVDLLPWASDHRAALVLKPNDEGGASDGERARPILVGANVEQGAWDRALREAIVEPSVLQRRVPVPSAMFPEVGALGEVFFSRRYIEVDPLLFRGEPRGLSTRLSATTQSNVSAGAGTVPTFILEDGDPV
jgi:hypothetical protein